jgi:hypothetical protein
MNKQGRLGSFCFCFSVPIEERKKLVKRGGKASALVGLTRPLALCIALHAHFAAQPIDLAPGVRWRGFLQPSFSQWSKPYRASKPCTSKGAV